MMIGMRTPKESVTTTARQPDSRQLGRQWALFRLLSAAPRTYSVKELAEQLATSKATIERDLATLETQFALVEEQSGKQKKLYRIDQKISGLEKIKFGTSELLAIYAALSSLVGLAGTPLHDDLKEVANKIRGYLSPHHNGGLDRICKTFLPHARGHVDYSGKSETIDDLTNAIAKQLVCKLTYHAAWKGTTREHVARPLRLVWHRSALYVLARLNERNEITTLAVHRIQTLEVSKDKFEDSKQDVEAHVQKAFGIFVSDQEEDVEIVFDAEVAWLVEERVHHPDENKQRLADGKLRYRLRTSAQWEIIPWVQSFGALAELVAPASWREQLAKNLNDAAAHYGE